jgi:hypothetical protein
LLAALIANNQNVVVHKTDRDHPRANESFSVKIDRSGGRSSRARYQAVDIVDTLRTFPEFVGEHPVTRAQRRARWIEEVLPGIREARERREAAVFLLGAEVGARAAEERHQEERRQEIDVAHMVAIYDEIAGARARLPRDRGDPGSGAPGLGSMLALIGIGVGIGLAIGHLGHPRRRR